MSFTELSARHLHDSRARRLVGYYREAHSALEQLAQRLRDEGNPRRANSIEAMTATLEAMAAADLGRAAGEESRP
jgi:primosomal protein N''